MIVAGWLWSREAEEPSDTPDASSDSSAAAATTTFPTNSNEPPPTNVGVRPSTDGRVRLPPSLEGTTLDGYFTVVEGRFVPDANAIRVFEYFLSTRGEVSEAEVRALVAAAARAQVPPGEEDAVMALFDDYLRYRESLADLPSRTRPDAYFAHMKDLQTAIFGDDADALFAQENMLAEHSLARSAIVTDESLDGAEKKRRLDALEESLPGPVREIRNTMTRQRDASAVVAQMRRDGLSEEDVFDYRADEFGEAAAARLQALDAQRADWDARLETYRAERDAIRARELGEAEEERLIRTLREEHFEPQERLRVEALDTPH